MPIALTRESSLHSPGAGMNPVSLVNASDAFCLSRHVVKKYYCLFLSSVLRSSIALSLIHVGCLQNVSALVTTTSVQFSLSIYIFFHRSVRHLRLLSFSLFYGLYWGVFWPGTVGGVLTRGLITLDRYWLDRPATIYQFFYNSSIVGDA